MLSIHTIAVSKTIPRHILKPCHSHEDRTKPSELAKLPSSGVRVIQMTLLVNFLLASIKLGGSWVFHSKALEADAWHSFTDLPADFLALIAVIVGSSTKESEMRRKDVKRVESLISMLMSGIVVAAGFHMLWDSVEALEADLHMGMLPQFLQGYFSPHERFNEKIVGHSHNHTGIESPSIQAIWPAVLTMIAKEALYRNAITVAKEIKSSVLASNATHQRADGLMSVVTIVATLGCFVPKITAWIDATGGLFISVVMLKSALSDSMSTLKDLVAQEYMGVSFLSYPIG